MKEKTALKKTALVCFALGALCVCGQVNGSGVDIEVEREFNELSRQIAGHDRWNNERLAAETLRREALILEGDRNPVDIVLRRTGALMEDLREMADGPGLQEESDALADLREQIRSIDATAAGTLCKSDGAAPGNSVSESPSRF